MMIAYYTSFIRHILQQGHISHSHNLGTFTVMGTTGNHHVVKLFPAESCSCPATSRCYHILAVRMSIGLDDKDSKKRVNLTQLRRKAKNKRDKKSGRKASRPSDYDVVPAPDAPCVEPTSTGHQQTLSEDVSYKCGPKLDPQRYSYMCTCSRCNWVKNSHVFQKVQKAIHRYMYLYNAALILRTCTIE